VIAKMGIISSIKESRNNKSNLKNPKKWLVDFFHGGQETYSGKRVDEKTAMKTSAVFACVDRLSSAMAALPLKVYKRTEEGRETAKNHFAYKMLHDEPNDELTSFTFRQLQMAHVLLWGNSYAEIERDNAFRAKKLWPLPPWKVEPKKDDNRGVYYEVMVDGKRKILYQDQVLHIRGLGLDGLKGLSRISMARQAVGLSLATEEYGARFFGQGANPGGIVEYPGQLSDDAWERYKKDMRKSYEGLSQSNRLMFLEEGMKYHETSIPPDDSQFLQTRKFQLTEIARIYNVPLHLLQEHENSTTWGSGIEHLNIGFVVFSLTPYLENWEQEIDKKIVTTKDYYSEHNVEGLLRGDSQARANFYNTMTNIGAYSINDVREKENMNKIDGGNTHFVPMNMMPLEQSEEQEEDIENDIRNRLKKQYKQKRQRRSAASRFKISKSYRKVFKDAAKRIVSREEADIMRKARKIFGENNSAKLAGFQKFLDEFYEDHPEYFKRQIAPAVTGLSEAISEVALDEVNYDDDISAEINKFDNEYIEALTARHIGSSKGQLNNVAETAIEEQEDILTALQTRFDEWQEKRPDKIANRETVQLSAAIAMVSYKSAGVIKKRWNAIGAETCEFCQEMDGMVVSIDREFLSDNDRLEAEVEGDSETMNIYHGIKHPQLHEGCVCTITAET